ncbi:MAG: hypothetical protein QW776_01340 [Candidatus Nitrosocaldus sp.]
MVRINNITIMMLSMVMMALLLLPFSDMGYAESMEDKAHDKGRAHDASKLHASSTVAGLHVELIIEPATIEPNIPVRFSLEFMDSITGELKDTVPHTFLLLKDGSVIFEEHTEHAGYVHEFIFSEEHKGPLTVLVRDVNNTGQDAEFSITVVPEFPTVMVVMMTATASALLLGRRFIADRLNG